MSQPRTIDRVLLVRTTKPGQRSILPPLGILYLAGALRKSTEPVPELRVIDYALDGFNAGRFGQAVREFDPDLVGLSGLTLEADLIGLTARLAREGRSDRLVVAGGPHASAAPGDIIADGRLDAAAIGEGELTLPELVRCWRQGSDPATVPGLALPGEDGPRFTAPREPLADLDDLPEPAWDLIAIDDYSARPILTMSQSLQQRPYAPIMTSRGCPYGCVYCHKYFGRKVRTRSPEHVVAEMEWLHRTHGVREFHIIDDCFNFDIKRAKTICGTIAERLPGISLVFPNGIRGDRLDSELLHELRRAGTYKIYFAVESGSPRVQRYINKGMDLEAIERNIAEADRLGITSGGFFMLGFPTETVEEMEETIRFAVRSRLDAANFFKVIPYPGTELSRMWTEEFGPWEGAGQDWDHFGNRGSYGNYHFATRSLPAPVERLRQVDRMVLRGYRRFYRNPARLFRYLRRHPNKLLALDNLVSVGRNIMAYHRGCWSRSAGGAHTGVGKQGRPATQRTNRRED